MAPSAQETLIGRRMPFNPRGLQHSLLKLRLSNRQWIFARRRRTGFLRDQADDRVALAHLTS